MGGVRRSSPSCPPLPPSPDIDFDPSPGRYFASSNGSITCGSCLTEWTGDGYWSSSGSSTCDLCAAFFFRVGQSCRRCPLGSTCGNVGTTLDTLKSDPGFYRYPGSQVAYIRVGAGVEGR